MQIIVWWDHTSDPTRPWRYVITYNEHVEQGECLSVYDCWRRFDRVIAAGIKDTSANNDNWRLQ